jgi:hypothetical protein
MELAGQTTIVHHIPGRIRLKVKLSGLRIAREMNVEDLVNHFDGILEARPNIAARSIIVTYDTDKIAPALWERLVNEKRDPSVRNSVREELERLFTG